MKGIYMTTLLMLTCSIAALVQVGVSVEQRSGRRISGGSSFKSPCGTADQLSMRGGQCLVPVFELLEGRSPVPMDDQDLQSSCLRFNTTSRCVRQISKDCLSGVHKTAVGALATGMRRFYTTDCKSVEKRASYTEPLKCAIKNGPSTRKVFETQTGIMQGIRDLPIPPEEKILKMCCVLNNFDAEVSKIFDSNCPESRPIVLKLIHAVTDDARNTLCANPKCKGALDQVKNHKYTPPQNFIEPVQQILFQITV